MVKNSNNLLKLLWFFLLEILVVIPYDKKSYQELSAVPNLEKSDSFILQPVSHVSYRTDTISERTSTLLFYSNGNITRLYKDGDNRYQMQMPYFAHENWHHHNDDLKYRFCGKLSVQEYVKLCAWDEISANLCAILTARYEYLYSKDPQSVIQKYQNTYMKFYFDAIKTGQITPNSEKISDTERAFLINGTKNMWLQKFWSVYLNTFIKKLNIHVEHFGVVPDNNKEYLLLRNNMLHMGGINFASYLKHDITIKNQQILSLAKMYEVTSFKTDRKDISTNINTYINKIEMFPEEQQKNILLHVIISTKLKKALESFSSNTSFSNEILIKNLYNGIESDLRRDQSFIKWLNDIKPTNTVIHYASETQYIEFIKDIYTYNGTDLTQFIDKNRFLNTIQYYKRFHIDTPTTNSIPLECLQTTNTTSPKPMYKEQNRKSSIQYIDLPNFSQPILTSSSNNHKKQIQKVICDFEDIPQVLKECDTQAQIKFLQKQSKIR